MKTLVVILTGAGDGEFAESVEKYVKENAPDADASFEIFGAEDWDGDYSPWKFETESGRKFAGRGKETIEKLKGFIYCKEYEKIYIAGYSLAGLFALWAVRETDWFNGCACCSGSLWFGGWEEYAESHPLKRECGVYLSLGGKESRAKDKTIVTIEERTRNEEKRLGKDERAKRHVLEMNPGGHFASPDKRTAQGILWLLKNG